MQTLNRRKWLRSSLATAAGVPFLIPQRNLISFHSEDSREIRLNSNENPHGPSPRVMEAITKSMTKANLYPWSEKEVLRKSISSVEGIPLDHIYIGAGSTEILQMAAMAFGLRGGKVVSGYPTFPVLMQKAAEFDAKWVKVNLNEHHYDLEALARHAGDDTNLLYICNPNNPTGTRIPPDELRDFCREMSEKTIVFVDEAYIEFSEEGLDATLGPLVHDHPNIIVARTFSKIYGLAGLRVGYAYAHPSTLKAMRKHRIGHGMNVSMTSIHGAIAALEDQDFVKFCRKENALAKQLVYSAFADWDVDYIPSQTSFIYFKHERFSGNLQKQLHQENIMIRTYPDQPEYARVSMGTVDQMRSFVEASKQFLS